MNTIQRIAATMAVPVLAPALSLGLLGAAPAHADAPQVTKSDFLTGAQVGKVFSDLTKSTPDFGSIKHSVYTSSCTQQKRLKVKADRYATYATATSKHIVQVSIAQMRSTSDAKKIVKGARTELKCGFVDLDGGAYVTKTSAPKVGSEAVGQLVRWADEKDEPARMAHYVFRTKKRVVTVLVAGESRPNLAKARKLAKQAYTVAR